MKIVEIKKHEAIDIANKLPKNYKGNLDVCFSIRKDLWRKWEDVRKVKEWLLEANECIILWVSPSEEKYLK